METLAPIYQEAFFAETDRSQATVILRNNTLWRQFFALEEKAPFLDFEKQSQGHVHWRRLFFWEASAEYKVVSFKKDEHLLLDIFDSGFRSSLLITFEEKKEGVIIRLDHRSFTGSQAKPLLRYFTGYWKKLFKALSKENSGS